MLLLTFLQVCSHTLVPCLFFITPSRTPSPPPDCFLTQHIPPNTSVWLLVFLGAWRLSVKNYLLFLFSCPSTLTLILILGLEAKNSSRLGFSFSNFPAWSSFLGGQQKFYLFFKTFYFELILGLQKYCKKMWVSIYPLPSFP